MLGPLAFLALAAVADFPHFEAQTLDPHAGEVVYAVTVADVDGDTKPDVVALTEDAVVWYSNPKWEKHVLLKGKTARDNVCIQPHDIDGDGRIDFAVGAAWKPADTNTPGTLQWIGRDAKGEWQIHPIPCDEPTVHRIRWADVKGTGKPQLIVAPLQGRGTKGPDWGKGQGVRIVVYDIPKDPAKDPWPMEVADDSLHTVHNIWPARTASIGPLEVLAASWEGVFALRRSREGKWSREKLGDGNQQAQPNKGASEIKLGRMANGSRYIATIEPWHGFQVAVYWSKYGASLAKPLDKVSVDLGPWNRSVIAEPLAWGHAVWCSDLDGDGDDELIIGQRDSNKEGSPKGPGVFVFDPKSDGSEFVRHTIDDGAMACEDALAADLDGDGRPEIIAGGRATHNVKVYWNRPKAKP